MNKTKILLVEDEIIISDAIMRYFEAKDYRVVGQAVSFETGLDMFLTHKPDITLMDIRLRGERTGIELAEIIKSHDPNHPIIFLTSQVDEQTINRAKTVIPAAYLSKPIQKQSLFASVAVAEFALKARHLETVYLQIKSENIKIPIEHISHIAADHIYSKIHMLDDGSKSIRMSLSAILELLPPESFCRVHRSYIINTTKVSHMENQSIIVAGHSIPVSRSKKSELKEMLSLS